VVSGPATGRIAAEGQGAADGGTAVPHAWCAVEHGSAEQHIPGLSAGAPPIVLVEIALNITNAAEASAGTPPSPPI
jgi:hypothetical protein